MKVGDLVKYKNLHGHVTHGKFISKAWVGLVTQTMGADVEILWNGRTKSVESKKGLEVISTLCNS
jgi:hypothetical protein